VLIVTRRKKEENKNFLSSADVAKYFCRATMKKKIKFMAYYLKASERL
jgi:hypothetical protein